MVLDLLPCNWSLPTKPTCPPNDHSQPSRRRMFYGMTMVQIRHKDLPLTSRLQTDLKGNKQLYSVK